MVSSAGSELRTASILLDDFYPRLRTVLGDQAETLADKLLKAGDGGANVLARLDGLDDDALRAFAGDFTDSGDLAKFAAKPELVDSWEVLKKTID